MVGNANAIGVPFFNLRKEKGDIPDAIRNSMILWYDIARQGATNESMAENPVLKDLSGNGHDATCYNFAWTEESGISTTNYPNALVSDGVDDYARFITFDLLSENKFYYIAKYVKIKDMKRWQYLLDYYNATNSVRYYIGNPSNNRNHYGEAIGQYDSDIFYGEAVYLYTGEPLYELTLFSNKYAKEGVNCAFYSLLLFNRTLTAEEIEWVKTNLIEAEQ